MMIQAFSSEFYRAGFPAGVWRASPIPADLQALQGLSKGHALQSALAQLIADLDAAGVPTT